MGSLRDIGYDLSSAIADLVDNSIDANARSIEVELIADGDDSWARITDDGGGMVRGELDEAMRYGSHADYGEHALGHYGLGLKTASLSQCRRLTVASRGSKGGQITVRRWDLDEVQRRDAWALESVRASDADPRLTRALAHGESGSVVLWEKLDRLLPRKPTPGMTARVFDTLVRDVRAHLAMVFHRFLDGEAYCRKSRLRLTLNGERVDAWDPYARTEPQTRALAPQTIAYEDADGRSIAVEAHPFVLPGQHLFSTPEAHRLAGGPNRWNRHQGFYLYRRDRLIQAGGWNRLRTLDEHAKLARIAIDLPLGDEDLFAVDVAKMRVRIPEELRPGLKTLAAATVAQAQERYRDHLDGLAEQLEDAPPPSADAISISRDWPAILAVVDDVLGDDLELRDQLLVRLANADPDDAVLLRSGD